MVPPPQSFRPEGCLSRYVDFTFALGLSDPSSQEGVVPSQYLLQTVLTFSASSTGWDRPAEGCYQTVLKEFFYLESSLDVQPWPKHG